MILLDEQVDLQSLNQQLIKDRASLQMRAFRVISELQTKAVNTQKSIINMLTAKSAGDVANYQAFWIANLIQVETSPEILMEISGRPDVAFMDIDPELQHDQAVAEPLPLGKSFQQSAQPGLKAINAHLLWEMGYTGKGRLVMNLDTGVNINHPALQARWRGHRVPSEQAWFDPLFETTTPNDRDVEINHGTHTMGTIAGIDTVAGDTIGVAFEAEWIASNAITGGIPFASRAIQALQWAMDPDGNPATIDDVPDAIANSWNDILDSDCETSFYAPVLNALETAGIAVVFSAGNDGPGTSTISAPKNINLNPVNVFAVGAVTAKEPMFPVAPCSSRGPSECGGSGSLLIKPEVSAPGVSVLSAQFGSYGILSGTSMACPHVTGAIALLKQAYPQLTGYELKTALYETARDLGEPGEDNQYGRGIIDVYAAFVSLGGPNPPSSLTAYSDYHTPNAITLTWQDPITLTNGDPLQVNDFRILIWRNESLIDSVAGGTGNYVDSGLTDGESYNYQIAAKLDSSNLTSQILQANWIAGGSPVPSTPLEFSVAGNQGEIQIFWINPAANNDGTPMDDFRGVNLYQNGAFAAFFERAAQDTGRADSAVFQLPQSGYFDWQISALDNEIGNNESPLSEISQTPVAVPFQENFSTEGAPNSTLWQHENTEINDRADAPPSGNLAINLNGTPTGEDILTLNPIDLSDFTIGIILSYYYQPQGQGNAPEAEDSLKLYLKNNLNQWILVQAYTGTPLQPFVQESIDLASAPAGNGHYFHNQFQLQFVSRGGAGIFPNDDWFLDDIYIGSAAVGIEDVKMMPDEFLIKPNYPNPFNPETTIAFQLPAASEVTLEIYNTLGQRIRVLVDQALPAGQHKIQWNARDNRQQPVASGIYLYRFLAIGSGGDLRAEKVHKMILIK